MLFLIVFCWWHSHDTLKRVILYKLINNNSEDIRNMFSNTVWKKYNIKFGLFNNDIDKILNSAQYKHFNREARAFFNNLNLAQVCIYTKYNQLLFSLNNYTHDQKYHILDLQANKIFRDDNYNDNIIATLPIYFDKDNSLTDAIIELQYDNTSLQKQINRIYLYYFVLIALLTIIVLTLVYYVLCTNKQALQKQYAINAKLKIAKENAEEKNVKKSIFLANISHELKTPLNSVIGFSQLILENPEANISNYIEYIDEIHNAGVHLLSLINDILDFSKTEVNKLSIQSNLFDLNKVLESSIKMVKPRAEKYHLTINVDSPKDPTVIKADAKRTKQVFLNLLSNSLKFTKENGVITVSIKKQPKIITIIIKDTGIGIAEKDLAQAMSTFGQTDNNLSRKYEGTGLGLPLSKNLIELMGGTFQVQSKETHGTKITITFPNIKTQSQEK